jgi:hypothetical protein
VNKITQGILRTTALILILALLTLIVVPVAAQGPRSSGSGVAFLYLVQGKVLTVSGNTTASFTIQNGNKNLTINTDSATKYFVINTGKAQSFVNNSFSSDNQQGRKNGQISPPRANDLKQAHIPSNWRDDLGWLETFDKQGHFSNIEVGDKVVVRITNDGRNLAKQILITKAPPIRTIKGKINSVAGNVISISVSGGPDILSLNVTTQTIITLKGIVMVQPGQTVVAVYNSANHNNALTINVHASQ